MNNLAFIITDIMEKSLEGDSRVRRILGGFAAGTTKDFQQERMILQGIDFDYLNSPQGKLNWDHNNRLLIGRPLFVGMVPNKGLYVKSVLSEKQDYQNLNHPDTLAALDKAEWAWDQAQRHKVDPISNVPLGYSVEGLKGRQGENVIKSIVTHVALTDSAVNPNDCTVEIMAKSILAMNDDNMAKQIIKQAGFPIEEIKDSKSYLAQMSKAGFPPNFSVNLFKKIRSL